MVRPRKAIHSNRPLSRLPNKAGRSSRRSPNKAGRSRRSHNRAGRRSNRSRSRSRDGRLNKRRSSKVGRHSSPPPTGRLRRPQGQLSRSRCLAALRRVRIVVRL